MGNRLPRRLLMGAVQTQKLYDHPTMDAPANGLVSTVVNAEEMPLSEAEYWVAEGTFVVRSREFDCFAEGPDLDSALTAFGRAVYDYADVLQRRCETGDATQSERESLEALSRRLSRIYLAERRQLAQSRGFWRRRRARSASRGSWRDEVAAAIAK
jgi:hypothetical protein